MQSSTCLIDPAADFLSVSPAHGQRATPTDFERALQALRDVRHMLPPAGVAIVDKILDGTGVAEEQVAYAKAPRFEAMTFIIAPEPLSAQAEDELLESGRAD